MASLIVVLLTATTFWHLDAGSGSHPPHLLSTQSCHRRSRSGARRRSGCRHVHDVLPRSIGLLSPYRQSLHLLSYRRPLRSSHGDLRSLDHVANVTRDLGLLRIPVDLESGYFRG